AAWSSSPFSAHWSHPQRISCRCSSSLFQWGYYSLSPYALFGCMIAESTDVWLHNACRRRPVLLMARTRATRKARYEMFGLTFEKLIVITFVVAVVVGPQRLPLYATKLAAIIRVVRDAAETAKVRAQNELGITVDAAQWSRKLQQYDPRRIIQETL